MIVEWWTRKGDAGRWWEWYGGYERISESRGTTCPMGCSRSCIRVKNLWISSYSCRIRNGKLNPTCNSLMSQCLIMISHLLSSLSFMSSIIPLLKTTKVSHPSLSLHAMMRSWHWVKHTRSTAYTQYCIYPAQHTPSNESTMSCIHGVLHTSSTAYTEYCIHWVLHSLSTAFTECCIHRVLHTLSTAYTEYYIPQVLQHRKIIPPLLRASLLSLSGLWCSQFSTFPQLRVNQWIESQLLSHLHPSLPPPDWSPSGTTPISMD